MCGLGGGRPHPAVTRTMQYAADTATCRHGQALPAAALTHRWKFEVQIALMRGTCSMTRTILPSSSAREQWPLSGLIDRTTCRLARAPPLDGGDDDQGAWSEPQHQTTTTLFGTTNKHPTSRNIEWTVRTPHREGGRGSQVRKFEEVRPATAGTLHLPPQGPQGHFGPQDHLRWTCTRCAVTHKICHSDQAASAASPIPEGCSKTPSSPSSKSSAFLILEQEASGQLHGRRAHLEGAVRPRLQGQ